MCQGLGKVASLLHKWFYRNLAKSSEGKKKPITWGYGQGGYNSMGYFHAYDIRISNQFIGYANFSSNSVLLVNRDGRLLR